MRDRIGPCMCGATDCRSCGPAQGYDPDYEAFLEDAEIAADETDPDMTESEREAFIDQWIEKKLEKLRDDAEAEACYRYGEDE